MLTRRTAILATIATVAHPAWAADDPFAAIEATLAGGRIGVFAIDLATCRTIGHRADERFAMCSTFKLPLAGAVLARVDARRLTLEHSIRFAERDLLEHAPAMRAALPAGRISVAAMAAGAVTLSDNSAANFLLPMVGGPAGLTRFARAHGDAVTRFDRTEPTLNTNLPGDLRDTTTPRAMAMLMEMLLVRPTLRPESRERLIGWMVASSTGKARLRAGLPSAWRAGDKTGTGERGAANDVVICWPRPGRPPVLIASYIDAPDVAPAIRDAAHAAVGRLVADMVR